MAAIRHDRGRSVDQDDQDGAKEGGSRAAAASEGAQDEANDDEEEEEEREPTLKYTKLTSHFANVYRNGDSTSAFLVTADKLVIGTHNGVIHVHSLPSLEPLRQYRAHSSTVTAVSVSPFSASFIPPAPDAAAAQPRVNPTTPKREPPKPTTASPRSPRPHVPATATNAIYIATASIDGHVCVSSLVDTKDVTLRNYSRPVHAVSISPNFKADHTYLSGGTAGKLICTTGGKAGVSSDANTNSAAAAASGWLGSIGFGSNTGTDTVIHSGEGTISSILWSLTGKFVAWANEYGTRIMHSHVESHESQEAWKRIGHVPRPEGPAWDDMAGVWKARMQWIDHRYLESEGDEKLVPNGGSHLSSGTSKVLPTKTETSSRSSPNPRNPRYERLLIGWGDTVWVLHIYGAASGNKIPGRAEIVHRFKFEDCVISGLTLYTPSILIALVFRTMDDDENPITVLPGESTPRRGRRNGLPPELRLLDLQSDDKDEIDIESVVVSRFERLSFADYLMTSLYVPPAETATISAVSRGAFEFIGSGLRDVGLTTSRLLSSGASVMSGSSGDDRTVSSSTRVNSSPSTTRHGISKAPSALLTRGLKVFVQSPFDCVLAVKRDLPDHLSWLLEHEEYESAWNLIQQHPEVVSTSPVANSRPSTPTGSGHSLADFFDDSSSQSTIAATRTSENQQLRTEAIRSESQRIGDLWVKKLVSSGQWQEAGVVAGKTLGFSRKWEDWILTFKKHNKYDDIVPYIPSEEVKPPLPSYIYELVLGHYIEADRLRFQELMDRWSLSLFDVSAVSRHIESFLESGEVSARSVEDGTQGRDWRILMNCLARLHLADTRPTDAVQCYLKTGNADAVLEVVREYAKIDAVSEDVFAFLALRIPVDQASKMVREGIDQASLEPVRLLADASLQGTVEASSVVNQLQAKHPASRPFMFLYFRQLWSPESPEQARGEDQTQFLRRPRFAKGEAIESPSRLLLEPFANTIVSIFADFSQALLNEFLKSSKAYTFEHASEECRQRHFVPELVYLLSATGQTKSALHLIIDELGDVPMAINFVKDTDEESLWNDLLEFSLDKPEFIRGMLEEVGTSVDPVDLVKRVPEGMAISGLKDSLTKLLKENEVTYSISHGASKVLQNEIATVMDRLRRRRERGVLFRYHGHDPSQGANSSQPSRDSMCSSCGTQLEGDDMSTSPEEHLLGFMCGHIYHLTCLLDHIEDGKNQEAVEKLQNALARGDGGAPSSPYDSSYIGKKVQHAQMIKGVLGRRGCFRCEALKVMVDDVGE